MKAARSHIFGFIAAFLAEQLMTVMSDEVTVVSNEQDGQSEDQFYTCGQMGDAQHEEGQCTFDKSYGCCELTDTAENAGVPSILAKRKAIPTSLIEKLTKLAPMTHMLGDADSVASIPWTPTAPLVKIFVQLEIIHFFNVNQKAQTFDMDYRLKAVWRDCRLLHGCSFAQLSSLDPRYDKFWKPSLQFEQQVKVEESMSTETLRIVHDGLVVYVQERIATFRCSFDFTDLPYDKQECYLTLLEPEWDSNFIQLGWITQEVDPHLDQIAKSGVLTHELQHAEWDIDASDDWEAIVVTAMERPYLEEAKVTKLQVKFGLNRRPRFLENSYIIPSGLFYLVSYVGLWVTPDAVPARAAVGVIPVLIMTTTLGALASSLPPIAYATRLGSFMLMTLGFIVAHMCEFGMVNYMMRRKKYVEEMKKKNGTQEADAETAETAEPRMSVMKKAEMTFVTTVMHIPFEVYMRVVSPIAYVICSCVIMLA